MMHGRNVCQFGASVEAFRRGREIERRGPRTAYEFVRPVVHGEHPGHAFSVYAIGQHERAAMRRRKTREHGLDGARP